MEDGVVKVVAPIEDTPAAKAGIQSEDVITAIDKVDLQGLTLEDAVKKMRGAVHRPVTLTIVRKAIAEPFDVKVVRDVIHNICVRNRPHRPQRPHSLIGILARLAGDNRHRATPPRST